MANLSNQALLAAVSTAILRDISNLRDILVRIKRFGLRKVNSRIDQPVLRTDVGEESSPLYERMYMVQTPRQLDLKMLSRFGVKSMVLSLI